MSATGIAAAERQGGVPDPVHRYLRHVLAERQGSIRLVRMSQAGLLRSAPRSRRWMRFRATHAAEPLLRRFFWDAEVTLLPALHLRVRDAYAEGVGSGDLRLLSAVTIGSDRNTPELNAASLHRYLAEAVWYPTALLPSAGVRWSAIDERSALAELTDSGSNVALEFHFNDAHEVIAVRASGRWRRSGKGYVLTPWEGQFSDYRRQQGMLVPSKAAVGWYEDGRLEVVWKADITSLEYEFEAA